MISTLTINKIKNCIALNKKQTHIIKKLKK